MKTFTYYIPPDRDTLRESDGLYDFREPEVCGDVFLASPEACLAWIKSLDEQTLKHVVTATRSPRYGVSVWDNDVFQFGPLDVALELDDEYTPWNPHGLARVVITTDCKVRKRGITYETHAIVHEGQTYERQEEVTTYGEWESQYFLREIIFVREVATIIDEADIAA